MKALGMRLANKNKVWKYDQASMNINFNLNDLFLDIFFDSLKLFLRGIFSLGTFGSHSNESIKNY